MHDKVPARMTDMRKYPIGTVVIRRGDTEKGFILSVDKTNISFPVRVRFPDGEETYTPSGKVHMGSICSRDIEYVLEFTVVEVPKPKQDPHLDSLDFFRSRLWG